MLHVADSASALEFYCEILGFEEMWRFQPDMNSLNPAYIGLRRDTVQIHISSFSGDGKPGGVAVIFVDGIDAFCEELALAGVDIGSGPVDQSWGNRECYIADPFGNQLRLTQAPDRD